MNLVIGIISFCLAWIASLNADNEAIYLRALKEPLPDWQRAIVLYNLGTIKLAQNQNNEALDYYDLIPLKQASSPQLIRSFYLNKGITFLNMAHALNSSKAVYDLYDQIYLYKNALKQFQEVEKLDCQLRALEGEDLATPCSSSPDLQTLLSRTLNDKGQAEQALLVHPDRDDTESNQTASPIKLLTRAWLQALVAQQATEDNNVEIAKEAQKKVVEEAKSFLPAVYRFEKEQYQLPHSICQKRPWDQVIPLFDKGYQAAIRAKKTLNPNEQKMTIRYWKEALTRLAEKQSPEKAPQIAQNINETLRVIQEMQAEDQAKEPSSSMESNTW